VEGSEALEFRGLMAKERYYCIEEVLMRFRYYVLKRDEKGVIRQYIKKVTGYSRSEVSRLLAEYKVKLKLAFNVNPVYTLKNTYIIV